MKNRAFLPYSSMKWSCVTSNVFFTPSRIAMLGTTTMNLLQPYRLFSSNIVLM